MRDTRNLSREAAWQIRNNPDTRIVSRMFFASHRHLVNRLYLAYPFSSNLIVLGKMLEIVPKSKDSVLPHYWSYSHLHFNSALNNHLFSSEFWTPNICTGIYTTPIYRKKLCFLSPFTEYLFMVEKFFFLVSSQLSCDFSLSTLSRSSHTRVFKSIFAYTSSHSQFAESLAKCPQRECKPGIKLKQ